MADKWTPDDIAAGLQSGRRREAERARAATMAAQLTELGWHRFILDRSAPERWATWLAETGLCSSISHQPGAAEWKLHLSKFGKAVRAVLETERSDA